MSEQAICVVQRRPGLLVGGSFVIGAALGETIAAPIWSDEAANWPLPALVALAIGALAIASTVFLVSVRPAVRRGATCRLAMLCVAVLVGLGAAAATAGALATCELRQRSLASEEEAILIAGLVSGVPSLAEDAWLLPVTVDTADGRHCRGTIQASLPVSLVPDGPPLAGDRVQLVGRLYLPVQQLNPYEYDGRRGLARDGVSCRMRVEQITRSADVSVPALLRCVGLLPSRAAGWCACRLQEQIDRSLTGDARSLALAFLLGNRLPLRSSELQVDFEAAGGLHLAAVSGLHVGLVASAIDALCGMLQAKRGRRNLITLGVAVLYSMMAGGAPSVVRATVMVGCVKLAPRHRRSDGLNTLCLAAAALAIANPLLAGDAGYQLSVLATLGILAAAKRRSAGTSQSVQARLATGILASGFAQLATLPVAVHCFCRISPWAPLSNLALLPLGSVAVTASFACACLGLVHPWLFRAAAPLLQVVLTCLASVVHLMARVPASLVVTGHPGAFTCVCAGMLVTAYLLAAWIGRPPGVLALAAVVALLGMPLVLHRPAPGLEVRFFAVGQGDCALLRAGSCAVLVDCGPPGLSAGPGNSSFARAVLPYLRATRTAPDLVVVSHPHADHCGGLPDLMRSYPDVAVLTREYFARETAKVAGLSPAQAGQIQGWARMLPIEVSAGSSRSPCLLRLSPVWAADLGPPAAGDANQESLGLRVELVGESTGGRPAWASAPVLFTGDVGAEAELVWMRACPSLLPAPVVKVPHHGSNGSNSSEFLMTVAPQLCVVCTGANRFGHPGAAAWERLVASSEHVVRTDRQGMVIVRATADGGVCFESFR